MSKWKGHTIVTDYSNGVCTVYVMLYDRWYQVKCTQDKVLSMVPVPHTNGELPFNVLEIDKLYDKLQFSNNRAAGTAVFGGRRQGLTAVLPKSGLTKSSE